MLNPFSYIETLGEYADAFHLWVNQCYEADFKRSFEIQVRKAIKPLHVSYVTLAFDIASEPFYSKTRVECVYLWIYKKRGQIETNYR